jgi:hypothetical protein
LLARYSVNREITLDLFADGSLVVVFHAGKTPEI